MFFGRVPPYTIKAQVWETDEKMLAIAGYWTVRGVAVIFSDMVAEMDVAAITIWRQAKGYMQKLDKPAQCIAAPGSETFLARLGWEHIGTSDQGEVFKWEL